MARIENGIDISGGKPDKSAMLIIIGLVLAGFVIGQFVGSIASIVMAMAAGAPVDELSSDPAIIYDYLSAQQLLASNALYTLIFTFFIPWFYLQVVAKKNISVVSNEKGISLNPFLLTVFATAAFMFFNNLVIEWNANMHLPEFMSGIEKWMQETESQLAEITERFTTFDNFGQFLFAFLVVAILPGIGEELLFRGVVQNGLHRWTKNAHLAIWISAFFFAAIHMQFYGLVPRMMLGALFGYIYVWSGNIWYPIIAHAVNNGLSLTLAYMYQLNTTELDIEDTEAIPTYYSFIGLVVCVVLLFLFRNYYLKQKVNA